MKYIRSLLKFFEGSKGERSSKRLIFILSALQLNAMVAGVLACFIYKREFADAVDLLRYYGYFVLVAGGFVTVEAFKKLKK